MICWNLHQTVGTMQIPTDYVRWYGLLDENQGPQQFCGQDPWLVCEVARTVHVWRLNHMKPEVCYYIFHVDVRLHPRL